MTWLMVHSAILTGIKHRLMLNSPAYNACISAVLTDANDRADLPEATESQTLNSLAVIDARARADLTVGMGFHRAPQIYLRGQ
jgi:hypothetical protein